MRKKWANSVSGNPKNFGVKIKSHEKTQSHLDASIAFGQWKAGQRIDRIQEQTSVTEATFWIKCLLRIININTRHGEPVIAREPRTRGRWRLPRWQLNCCLSWRCKRGSTRSCNRVYFKPIRVERVYGPTPANQDS